MSDLLTATLDADPRAPRAQITPSVLGLGAALPEGVVDNAEIAARLGVDEDWIVQRTGIHRRRRAGESSLPFWATRAAHGALEDAALPAAELDLVLIATMSNDSRLPNAAPLVASALGAERAGAFDIGAACTGFLSGLACARAFVASGAARHVLVVGAELLSRHVDQDDRRTAALFGDGAGAVVVGAGGPGAIGPVVLGSDGERGSLIRTDPVSELIGMDGHETFKQATRRLAQATHEACEAAAVDVHALDLYVYHQANERILARLSHGLGLNPEKVVSSIAEHGNTSAASVPLALAHAREAGLLRPGMKVLLAAVGSGFTWGATVVDWRVGA